MNRSRRRLVTGLGATALASAGGWGLWRHLAAPADDPKLAMALLVENGGSGSGTAAPIAREVFDYYLLGKRNPAREKLDPDA